MRAARHAFALMTLVLVAFAACAHRQHVLGEPSTDVTSCKQTSDCPWGYECQNARCFESECHDDDPKGPLGLKSCTSGTCEYDGDDALAHGNGACDQVPLSQ